MQVTQELLMISLSNLWQEVQNQIPNISFEDNFFESTSGMREFRHWNFPSLISPLLYISNIYAQFVPVNRGLNSAYIMLNNFFGSTSGMREFRHWNFQSFISTLL